MSAGIEQHGLAIVHDEVLVRLHREAGVAGILEQDVTVGAVVEQHCIRHERLLRVRFRLEKMRASFPSEDAR